MRRSPIFICLLWTAWLFLVAPAHSQVISRGAHGYDNKRVHRTENGARSEWHPTRKVNHEESFRRGMALRSKGHFQAAADAFREAMHNCGDCRSLMAYRTELFAVLEQIDREERSAVKDQQQPATTGRSLSRDERVKVTQEETDATRERVLALQNQERNAMASLQKWKEEETAAERRLKEIKEQTQGLAAVLDKQQRLESEQRRNLQTQASLQQALLLKQDGRVKEAHEVIGNALVGAPHDSDLQREFQRLTDLMVESELTFSQVFERELHRLGHVLGANRTWIAKGILVLSAGFIMVVFYVLYSMLSPHLRRRRHLKKLVRQMDRAIDEEVGRMQTASDPLKAQRIKDSLRAGMQEHIKKARTQSILETEEQLLGLIRSIARQFSNHT